MALLTGWESVRELFAMQDRMNRMNRLFRESNSPEVPEEALTTTTLAPPADIYEDEHNTVRRRSQANHYTGKVMMLSNVYWNKNREKY
jgi:hypothetical protein